MPKPGRCDEARSATLGLGVAPPGSSFAPSAAAGELSTLSPTLSQGRGRTSRRGDVFRLHRRSNLLQRARILDRREVAWIAALAARLDRAAEQLPRARLRQQR